MVPFGTADAAPVSGEVRFFTDFGYGVGGPEYGYLEAAPPLYAGSYAEMFAE